MDYTSEDLELPLKEVFVLSLGIPNTPKYYVYKEKVAEDLKTRIEKTYGTSPKIEKVFREVE